MQTSNDSNRRVFLKKSALTIGSLAVLSSGQGLGAAPTATATATSSGSSGSKPPTVVREEYDITISGPMHASGDSQTGTVDSDRDNAEQQWPSNHTPTGTPSDKDYIDLPSGWVLLSTTITTEPEIDDVTPAIVTGAQGAWHRTYSFKSVVTYNYGPPAQ